MIQEYIVLSIRNAEYLSTFECDISDGLSEWLDLWIDDFVVENYESAMSISHPFLLVYIEVNQIKPDAYEKVINQKIYPKAWTDNAGKFSVFRATPWKGKL